MRRLMVIHLVLGTIAAAPLAAQMRVDNADIWLTRGTPVATFTVGNEGTEPLQYTLTTGDWDRDGDGTNRFLPAGSTPTSCERAMEVFPRQFRVAPGANQDVRVSLRTDSLPNAACWSIIFVQTEPNLSGQRSTAVSYVTRIGVKVYFNPDRTVTLAEVEGFRQLPPAAPGDSAAVEIIVRNSGTRQVKLNGAVEIRRVDNIVVARVPVEDIPILPSASRRIRVALPTIQTGGYVALAILDYGGDEDLAAQVPVQIP